MKALILHAHPDDEILFAGALMLARPKWEWTTVSLTGGLRAKDYPGICLGFDDPWRLLTVKEYHRWEDAVRALDLQPDIVFTHNAMGEYGHPHHMSVHRIAHTLWTHDVWDFYVESESSVSPQQGPPVWGFSADSRKRDLFVATYGQAVLDELTADKPELLGEVFAREWFTGMEVQP